MSIHRVQLDQFIGAYTIPEKKHYAGIILRDDWHLHPESDELFWCLAHNALYLNLPLSVRLSAAVEKTYAWSGKAIVPFVIKCSDPTLTIPCPLVFRTILVPLLTDEVLLPANNALVWLGKLLRGKPVTFYETEEKTLAQAASEDEVYGLSWISLSRPFTAADPVSETPTTTAPAKKPLSDEELCGYIVMQMHDDAGQSTANVAKALIAAHAVTERQIARCFGQLALSGYFSVG